MTLQMQPVTGGNNIKGIGFDPETKQLHIEFVGGTYIFDDVPAPLYDALMKSETKGSFFHGNIRGRYAHRKMSHPGKA